MILSFTSLRFKFPWRTYQAKFLNHFVEHIKDNHLHVVAPPGSGKTILGLEMVRLIGKKTLVLSPTLTIRNQWENRLQEFFAEESDYNAYSFDVSKPSDITFSTYQGLHAFYKKQASKEEFLTFFRKQGVEALVLDEAHHLKNEWWKCLYALKLDQNLTMVALTATPPYDSGSIEVQRYFDLCGAVDDEIAIPDLVKEGDLCPHQDFVHYSLPDTVTINFIVEFRRKVGQLLLDIQNDSTFRDFALNHRFYSRTESCLDEIYQNPTYFSALLIYLQSTGVDIPYKKVKILGFGRLEKIEFPSLNNHWLEVLLQHLFFTDRNQFFEYESFLKRWEKELRTLGVLKTKRVDLIGSDAFYRALATSPSKLNSIVTITENSYANLKEKLRGVILTDYIRKEYLNTQEEDVKALDKLGVLSIFHRLRLAEIDKKSIGILTGSIVIISRKVLLELGTLFPEEKINRTALRSDSDFVIIRKDSSKGMSLVEMITELFQKGYINILIGTKSFLGEGWDAPAINTLILASFVGSFVSSNQMRGRAIRSLKGEKNKTAVIWHLACLEPFSESGGRDYETLSRRFTAFMGVSTSAPVYIENGMDRIGSIPEITEEAIEHANSIALRASVERAKIRAHWKTAIETGNGLVWELKKYFRGSRNYKRQKALHYRDMVVYSFAEIIAGLSFFLPEFLLKNTEVILTKGWLTFLYALITAFVMGFGVKTWKAIKLYITYGKVHKDIESMGCAVVAMMTKLGYITSDEKDLNVVANVDTMGTVSCMLLGATDYESAIFINALDEIVAPIENPRYLLVRGGWVRKVLGIDSYFVVPTIFGDKKEKANLFLQFWIEKVGGAKLLYTRSLEGRKLLLKARILHISNTTEKPTKKAVIWK
ncbi:DEAD/DEAH box helicase family protein [uncultured Maribacter sp.]|uniref:DEAD/DEAH box helicase family protein n=1 Tax=uncultured Maribacter sp. TaxID=431308 RepID=UPI00262F82AD|nr:DEAD/DEAH box helicase family protein [uncultured Maribacter sp.]